MSLLASKSVWSTPLKPAALKIVALALADWCDDDGRRLYPSIAAIAMKVSLTDAQTRRHVHALMAMGLLSVEGNERGGAPGTTRQYRLHIDRLTATAHVRGSTGVRGTADAPEGSPACSTGLTPTPVTANTDATQSPSSRQGTTKNPLTARATRLPRDFVPEYEPEAERGIDRAKELANFSDYWNAKAGKDAYKRDWQAMWRYWVRNAKRNPADVARMTVPGPQGEDAHLKKLREDAANATSMPPDIRTKLSGLKTQYLSRALNEKESG